MGTKSSVGVVNARLATLESSTYLACLKHVLFVYFCICYLLLLLLLLYFVVK